MLGGTEKRIDAQWIISSDNLSKTRTEAMQERAKTVEELREKKLLLEKEKLLRYERLRGEKRLNREKVRDSSKNHVEILKQQKKRLSQEKKVKMESTKTIIKSDEKNGTSIIEHQEETSVVAVEIDTNDLDAVKVCLSELSSWGEEEIDLERLQECLLKAGHDSLCDDVHRLQMCLLYLDATKKIYYKEEVIWII